MYPLWLCPFVLPNNPGLVHPKDNKQAEMYVDIGAYGAPKTASFDGVETTRRLEKFVRDHNGWVIEKHGQIDRWEEEVGWLREKVDWLREKVDWLREKVDWLRKNVDWLREKVD